MKIWTKEIEERFWSHVDARRPADCWLWFGATLPMREAINKSYGKMAITLPGSSKQTTFLAHRLAWEMSRKRTLKSTEMICHECGNSLCCNPLHLYKGSQESNMQDMIKHGNSMRGSKHHSAKLTKDKVKQIRQLWQTNAFTQSEIAKMFNVSAGLISQITVRRIWRHV